MATINRRRMTADIEGDFVIFIIGMRINKPWKVHRWLPVFMAMPRMLRELEQHPEIGLLGYRNLLGNPLQPVVLQYWRSFEHLDAYARSRDGEHFPAWVKFNKTVANNGDVGIWHETYKVAAGQYETVYNNMPPCGLGKVANLVPAAGYRATAAGRVSGVESGPPAVTSEGDVAEEVMSA
jgi:hypothetical protein